MPAGPGHLQKVSTYVLPLLLAEREDSHYRGGVSAIFFPRRPDSFPRAKRERERESGLAPPHISRLRLPFCGFTQDFQ